MTLKKKTSLLSDSRFPAFIRDNPDYDMMRRFVQSYFESLEQEGQASFEILNSRENSDIDSTTDNYLSRMYKELCPNLPKNILSDKRFLLKHSRELYEKKGTPDSFKMLFRILFNQFISLKYPNENILRASDGIWNQPVGMQVIVSGSPKSEVLSLVNQEITTVNGSGLVRNFIRQVRHLGGYTYEFVIDKQKNVQFFVNDKFTANGVNGFVIPAPTKIEIIKAGKKFTPGQLIKLDIDGSKGTIAKVKTIGPEGAIKTLQIIKFGTGYNSDFSLTVSPSKGKTTTTSQQQVATGPNLPLSEYGDGFVEYGSISQTGKLGPDYDYFLDDYVEIDYIASVIRQFISRTPPPIDNDGITEDDYAILNIKTGPVFNYPGFWSNSRGNLSDPLICIQDNDFYQDFSYVIQSSVPREKYLKPVKENVHPAGLKMFSDLLLDNTIDISSAIANIDPLKYRLYLNDLVDAPDFKKFDMVMPKEDAIDTPEEIFKLYEKNTFDSVEQIENVIKDISRELSETIAPIDALGFHKTFTFEEYVDNGELDNYVDEGYVVDLYTTQTNGPSLHVGSQKNDVINTQDNNSAITTISINDISIISEAKLNDAQIKASDATSATEQTSTLFEIPISETINNISDNGTNSIGVGFSDSTTTDDLANKTIAPEFLDSTLSADNLSNTQTKILNDYVDNAESDKYAEDGYFSDGYTVYSTGMSIS